MYSLDIDIELLKKFDKLKKKNKKQLDIILKKVEEVLINPNRYKNLRAPLNEWKRIHIDKHFVLTFSVNEDSKTVTLEDYEHHDNIYKH
jgi:YafQ family addiction module toxin component